MLIALAVALLVALGGLYHRNKASVAASSPSMDEEYDGDVKFLFNGEMDSFRTENGLDIDIFSIKHASIAFRIDGKWIYADPVTTGALPETDYSKLPKADYILVTHNHYDHLDTLAISQLSTENTVVVADRSSVDMLGFGNPLENGEKFITDEGWRIDAVPAYNTSPDKLQFHPSGRDNGYVLTVDGFRIYISGDTEDIKELSRIKDIDVAFLPCNLPYTMTPEQCARAAKAVMPKVLFPYHYGDTDIKELALLLEGSGIDVRIRQYQ